MKLRNFMSYRNEDVDFSSLDITAIIGSNGAGKTALVKAILYCFFGESEVKSDDELSYGYNNLTKEWNVDKLLVSVTFKILGGTYKVMRRRSKHGTRLKFTNKINDKVLDLTGNTIKDTQKNIEDVLGMNYDSFVASVILKQNDYDTFLKMSPSDAKKVLMKIIGIDNFENKFQLVKEKKDKIEIEKNVLSRKLESLNEEINEIEDVDKKIKSNTVTVETLKSNL